MSAPGFRHIAGDLRLMGPLDADPTTFRSLAVILDVIAHKLRPLAADPEAGDAQQSLADALDEAAGMATRAANDIENAEQERPLRETERSRELIHAD